VPQTFPLPPAKACGESGRPPSASSANRSVDLDSCRDIPFPPAKAQKVAFSLRKFLSRDCSYECDGNTPPKKRTSPGSEAMMGPRAGRGMALFSAIDDANSESHSV
jgi:hypothetical protein